MTSTRRPGSNRIAIPGLDVHYLQQGTGEPVVLLHGFPETSHQWRHQIPALADAGFAVFAPDNRGFGATDKPDVRISRGLLARDVADLLTALGIERAAVVGHDWGGIIAAKLAFDHPDRVARLALLDTLATVWAPRGIHGWWFKSEGRAEAFFAEHTAAWLDAMLGGGDGSDLPGHPESPWVVPAGRGPAWCDPEDIAHYVGALADPAARSAAIQYYRYGLPFHRIDAGGPHLLSERAVADEWERPDFVRTHIADPWYPVFGPEDAARTFTGPTLWMYAAGDRSTRAGTTTTPHGNPFVDQFAGHYPDLRCLGVGCGHFIPEEAPEVANDALIAFLGGAA